MSSFAAGGENHFADSVTYRVLKPGVFTPPKGHKRLADGIYRGPYETKLELADELDVIQVSDWGDV